MFLNSSALSLLAQIYENYHKQHLAKGPDGSLEDEMPSEEVVALQHKLSILQKREELAKQTLLEAQTKWTNFSREILNIAREFYASLASSGAT